MIEEGRFVEWAEVYGNFYGTSRDVVERALNTDIDLLFDIDIQGAQHIKSVYSKAVLIFVLPPHCRNWRGD